jgi:hypothetical protein
MKEYKLNPPDVVTVSRLLKVDSIYKDAAQIIARNEICRNNNSAKL